jgi:hypothetical protein
MRNDYPWGASLVGAIFTDSRLQKEIDLREGNYAING